MKKLWVTLISLTTLILLFLAAGCASNTPVETAPKTSPASTNTGLEKAAWEVEWEKAIIEGKKEGKVVIYANIGKDTLEAWRKAFNSKYSITLEAVAGRSTEIAEKALTERRAGLYMVDVFIGGDTTSMYLKNTGVTVPIAGLLLLPEVTDPTVWWEGKLPFLDKAGHVIAFRASPNTPFVVNTNLVKPGEITGYKDLLNPKWKGKIIMNDPTVAGSGHDLFFLVSNFIYNVDYWKELIKLDITISRDQRLPAEWVARGKLAIGMGLKADAIAEFQNAGAPLDSILPSEGTYITPGASTILMMDKAPHPQASKVFINWLLTRESLEIASRAQSTQSARVDLPTDFLPPEEIRNPRGKYYPIHSEEASIDKLKYMDIAKEIFAPVMK